MAGKSPLQIGFVIATVAVIGFYVLQSDESATRSPTREQPAAAPTPLPPGYASAAMDNSWPPVQDGSEALTAPADLMAANYYIILDGSGSMAKAGCSRGESKMEVAVEALKAFVRAVPEDANVGLLLFSGGGITEPVPLGRRDPAAMDDAVRRMRPDGGTPLKSSIELAYQRLSRQGERQLGYGEYHLVVVTDGMASEGEDPRAAVSRLLAESPVNLHTIGFCIGTDHVLNQPGRSAYKAADNPEALRAGLAGVLAEAPSFDVASF